MTSARNRGKILSSTVYMSFSSKFALVFPSSNHHSLKSCWNIRKYYCNTRTQPPGTLFKTMASSQTFHIGLGYTASHTVVICIKILTRCLFPIHLLYQWDIGICNLHAPDCDVTSWWLLKCSQATNKHTCIYRELRDIHTDLTSTTVTV